MTTINIRDLRKLKVQQVYGYVMALKETEFEILVPKHVGYGGFYNEAFLEYCLAGWAGQKLYEVSSSFSYWVAGFHKVIPFCFHVTIEDLEKFADVINYLVDIYYRDENILIAAHLKAVLFFEKAANEKVVAASWGIFHMEPWPIENDRHQFELKEEKCRTRKRRTQKK